MEEEVKAEQAVKQVNLQRLYIKEQQCKLNHGPDIFKSEWQPEITMEMENSHTVLENNIYEAVLKINISAKNNLSTVIAIEIQQAGIFQINGFSEKEKKNIFSTHVPNLLYPYARQVITNLSTYTSLPPINIAHVDFGVLVQQQMEKQKQQEAVEEKSSATIN